MLKIGLIYFSIITSYFFFFLNDRKLIDTCNPIINTNPEIIFSFMENNFATSMFNKENILTYVILVSIIFFIFKNLFLSIIRILNIE